MNAKQSVTVLGAGSWGTALAILIASNGHDTILWGRNSEHMAKLRESGRNERYLPGIDLPKNLAYSDDLESSTRERDIVIVAVPSHAFAQTLIDIKPFLAKKCLIGWATKGIDRESGCLLHELVARTLPENGPGAAISGPSFAKEVAKGLPTAISLASPDAEYAEKVANVMRNRVFRIYTSVDVIGVELGGAVKNALAIATGIADGLGFGANTRSALITRGLTEMIRLGITLGGKQETFMGLAGLGDMILTCTDNQSRNRRMGLGLGAGKKREQVAEEIGQEIEGIAAARAIHHLSAKVGVEMPITEQVYRILYEGLPPQDAVNNLLTRDQKAEGWAS